ncbi:hypothetical protein AAKU67_003936 [Oxalobacteraceae bacterium GrIS 2.11]
MRNIGIGLRRRHRVTHQLGMSMQTSPYMAKCTAVSNRPCRHIVKVKANGIEPFAWLKDALEKLPTCPNSRLDELLPLST